MEFVYYGIGIVLAYVVTSYVYKKFGNKIQGSDNAESAPYKVEPPAESKPLKEVVSTPMVDVSPEIVAKATTPELKVVSGKTSTKQPRVKKSAAPKPAVAKKTTAVKKPRAKKPTDNA